ncbi:glycosyltransferase family 32 protein [Pedobacter alpinus]|uniref:Glycosyltransferase family 32 protein n=1 Tax=Pedobacter alpinus TaxID=1590643 RepID=A0ABW5TWQ5_9SPHI
MAIPKVIYQTFKTKKLPLITKWHIWRFKKMNPEYKYEFYDDERIDYFFKTEFDTETYLDYKRLNIGAAKADFFRYSILYKYGGVYLDIDSGMNKPLRDLIKPDDVAIITKEKNHPELFAQWALIYSKGHPFLKATIEEIRNNIALNKYPHDVHKMTGPFIYTTAINKCLTHNKNIPHRLFGLDYDKFLKVKYKLGKLSLYGNRSEHWKKQQLVKPVLKNINS